MNDVVLHCGGKPATRAEMAEIPLPEQTETYFPVGHVALVEKVEEIAADLIDNFVLRKQMFGLTREGRQLFAVLSYERGDLGKAQDKGLSIGIRNSYDKSLSVGIVMGASVFVCDNLAFTGDISIMRKHTFNVQSDIETLITNAITASQGNFEKITEDADTMASEGLSNDQAYQIMGYLYGHGILSPRQFPVVQREWLHPTYPAFSDRNLWSFYNACTAALKSTPPKDIMERHVELHREVLSFVA